MDAHAGGVVGRLADAETISESIGVGSKLFRVLRRLKKMCVSIVLGVAPGARNLKRPV